MRLPSKYAGTCDTCGKPYKVGDPIEWSKNEGSHHAACKSTPKDYNEFTPEEANALADRLKFGKAQGELFARATHKRKQ